MNVVAMQAILSGAAKAATPHASTGVKWGAVLSGLGLLVVLYLLIAAISGHWNPKELFQGFDGFASTSKLQWLAWLVVILFGYTALWVLRAEQSDLSSLSNIPVNILTVLGFSTVTAAAAKGITAGYVQTGRVVTTRPPAAGATRANTGGIFQDDGGTPELAKIQMIGFTIIAIGIFLATVIHQIVTNDIAAGLPDIDASLMVLMGISNGGYLGKKLVTFGTPGATGQVVPPGQVTTAVQNGSDGQSPVAPSPVASSPVAPSPVAPNPVASSPVAPSPSAPNPSSPSSGDGPSQPDPPGA